jgi:SAM-dependent methyltransferase
VNALYDTIGKGYANHRRPDPRIAAMIATALGDARSVVNVGAGAGSYEPRDRHVVAVEPSLTMIAQRPPGSAEVIQGFAEKLPFPDKSFDAATAFLTTHHWSDLDAGLREMVRVSRKRCVFFDQEMRGMNFWLLDDYFPEMKPRMTALLPLEAARAVFGAVEIVPVPVPHDCSDGFFCAYWRRPQAYLDPQVRAAISFFALVPDSEARIARLARDLDDGTWMRRHGHILDETAMDFGYRLVIAEIGAPGR